MRVALDTNRYVDLCKGVAETVAILEEAEAETAGGDPALRIKVRLTQRELGRFTAL